MTPSEVQSLVEELERTGDLPANLPKSTVEEVSKSLSRYFNQVSADKIQEFTDKAKSVIEDALNTEQLTRLPQDEAERAAAVRGEPGLTREATVGESRATARGKLLDFLGESTGDNIGEAMNLDFFLRIPMEVAEGAAQKLAQNWDEDRVKEFPGLEFHRLYERDVPRGSEKDPEGPDNSWDEPGARWQSACEEAGDEEALAAFEATGRCVALKSSEVWAALGDGAGGYTDTLGNDFSPYAFNSGWGEDELSYDDCVELGLLEEGEEPERPELDLADLIPGLEARSGSRASPGGLKATFYRSGRQNAVETVLASPAGLKNGGLA